MESEENEEHDEEEMSAPQGANYESRRVEGGERKGGGYRYRECQKNHAVGIGGHAVDGCGEFMAAGDEGTLDALRCAACSCHRNFHRKVPSPSPTVVSNLLYYRPAGYLHVTPPATPVGTAALLQQQYPPTLSSGKDQEEMYSTPSSSGGSKKRFRTKFTGRQKEMMMELAEKLGWRLQKQDEAAVQQFCAEAGVKRHALKVWMHNNKHTFGKKP